VSGGKGSKAHFVWRCGLCGSQSSLFTHDGDLMTVPGKRESSAKFDPTPITPYTSENAQFQPLLVIECRGLEFIEFEPRVRTPHPDEYCVAHKRIF